MKIRKNLTVQVLIAIVLGVVVGRFSLIRPMSLKSFLIYL